MNLDLFADVDSPSMREFEELAMRRGYRVIAGIDEAGRGPLAGPVVAAAVVLPTDGDFAGINDSKKLSALRRETLYDLIMERAVTVGVGAADHMVIDQVNILQATLHAMAQAVASLAVAPDYLLIDGISTLSLPIHQRTIKKGDSASLSIAAASIVAKVTRDRLMVEYDRQFPGYGFAEHKGYGCAAHLRAIAELGPCPIHRRSFRGVREYLNKEGE